MVPLGDHLSPDEDIDLSLMHGRQGSEEPATVEGAVGVKPSQAGPWKKLTYLVLDPLGAESGWSQIAAAAIGAQRRSSQGKSTIVTDQSVAPFVPGQGDVTVVALHRGAAVTTERSGSEAAAINE
jgi:hypothetical protein